MTDFSPREIVSELDRYIVGQAEAKRAVALAGVRAVAGIGDTHGPLTAAVLDLVALHGQVLGVLAVGCAAMAGGLDRAAAAYRDVEAAVAASIGSGT